MISHEHKCIFVHVPRTGGSSVEYMILGAQLGPENELYQKHLTASQLKDKYPSEWDSYWKFSIVRNPWARVVSLYHMPFYRKVNALSGKSMEYFLKNQRPPDWEKNGQQCADYLNEEVDSIGRYEDYRSYCRFLCERLGVAFMLPHIEKTEHRHYSEYYDEATRDLVREVFADDIRRFGYEDISD